jgi:large subunit ribosomal protein L4
MPNVKVFNIAGEEISSIDLPDDIFANDRYDHLLHQVVRYSQAHRRQGTQKVKTRSEVRGGGKKVYRQKGTGRARHGGSRAPGFRGGGVAHGPAPRSYRFKLNKKVRRNALCSALTRRATSEHVIVFDSLDLEGIKTKRVAALLNKLGINSALFVLPERDEVVAKSARNIPYVKVLAEQGLNVEDVLRHEHLVLTTATVAKLQARFGGEA